MKKNIYIKKQRFRRCFLMTFGLSLNSRLKGLSRPIGLSIKSISCSRGRIRTDNQLVTLVPMFPKGVDYIIALSKKRRRHFGI